MVGTETQGLPLDWNDWHAEWVVWRVAHVNDLKPTKTSFPGKNFLADEILGTWKINGRVVELSEVTFPNLTERDERGNLKHYNVRGIGLTFEAGDTREGTVVHSFAELNEALGL